MKKTNLIAIAILAAVLIGNVILTYNIFTKPYPGFNDFMTPWEASRSYFNEGLNPYSAETSLNIQEKLYGRAARPDEQPNHFAYPFYAILFVYPLIHLDYAWATAVWMVVCEVCLIGAVLLLLDIYRWRARPLTLVGLLLFSLAFYPAARGLTLGQVSHLVYFLQVLALWALVKDRDNLTGVALALSTFKPQMSVFLVPLILLWALYARRFRIVTSFAAVFAALIGVSFLLQPDWVTGFLYQLTLYPTYIEVSTPAWVIAQYILNLGSTGEIVINVVLFGVMLWTWFMVLVQKRDERFLWVIMITLTTTHMIGLRTASPHFVIFMIPLVFYLRQLSRRRQGVQMAVLLFALFLLPWLHFLATIGGNKFEHPSVFLPLPLLTYLVLWLTRKTWWEAAPVIQPNTAEVVKAPAT